MKKTIICTVAILSGFLFSPLSAQESPEKGGPSDKGVEKRTEQIKRFMKKDGEPKARLLEKYDANKDGTLSDEEIATAAQDPNCIGVAKGEGKDKKDKSKADEKKDKEKDKSKAEEKKEKDEKEKKAKEEKKKEKKEKKEKKNKDETSE